MSDFEIYKKAVKDMIKCGESDLYIRIYINDLYRGKVINKEQWEELRVMYITTNFKDFNTILK